MTNKYNVTTEQENSSPVLFILRRKRMRDLFENTRNFIDEYNRILDKICYSQEETTDHEDEFV